MATFEEFRANFPEDSNQKGERFEIFLCDWFLKNHPTYKNHFKKVWRFTDWPKRWHSEDIGTDLIAEDHHGKICAIQAKFYQARNSIPKGHVDSFLSDSARKDIDYRLLIATTDKIGLNATVTIEGQEKEVQLFLLQDFLDAPINWPKSLKALNQYKPRKPHKPRPHQSAAISAVAKKNEARGQLIMACGTGKTLTGQRIAEKLESKSTLVLLPSLLLLSKTALDWNSESESEFIFLPVCSDKSVTKGTDELAISNSQLNFRATTEVDEIAAFLRRRKNKVIFSTYQSSPQIAEAFKRHKLPRFDLIIADEAHRCAGRISEEFSTVLSDKLLPAKRRLFMTATPRTYSARLRTKAKENDIEVASMDDGAVFGPVLHRLTFGQAIANDPPLLTDYRVLVVGVNDAMVQEMVDHRKLVKTDTGLEDDAKSLATQIGLSKAVKDYDLTRVISFHSRVNLAKNFSESFIELQEFLKPDSKPAGRLTYSHVSGAMPTSERNLKLRALGALENEDHYLLGNARCLSEGVDVPALDGVAFVDPKRSEIDIIQAVGRAIRLSEGKETGTIVIPVFISDSDDPDEVLQASDFDQVWKVVNALRSHDETLGELLDELRVKLGRKQKINLKGTKIVFDVPKQIGNDFVEAFETRLVETTTASWEAWFDLLEEYKKEFGDCLVPSGHIYKGVRLGNWVNRTRTIKDRLSQEQISRLDEINFVWDTLTHQWEEAFNALVEYKAEFGDGLVRRGVNYKGLQLGDWVNTQRSKKDSLSEERISRLYSIDFVWDPFAQQWEESFNALVQYKAEHGDCLVAAKHVYKGLKLGGWVHHQRSNKDKLSEERVSRLDSIGFVWDVDAQQWEKAFNALVEYKVEHQDCLVPSNYVAQGLALGGWVRNTRSRKDRLSEEQISRLDSIGFVWDSRHQQWEEAFSALVEYKKEFGDFLIPARYVYKGLELGRWVSKQRSRKDGLSEEQISRLDSIGFVWDSHHQQWEEAFSALVEYKKEFGDSLIPARYVYKGLALGGWVSNTRSRKDGLSEEQISRLDSIGFIWDRHHQQWEEAFSTLVEYKAEHGDCEPKRRVVYKGLKLGPWVDRQRRNKDSMSQERISRLDEIGFVWKLR